MLDVLFGQATDPGKIRTNNEDSVASFLPNSRQQARSLGYLFTLADGVGGLDLGEIASATAVQAVTEGFRKAQEGTMLISLLPRLLQHANAAVHDAGLDPERRGKKMATTIVACALRYDQAVISNVGDSRCYLVRNGEARILSTDHTWVNEQRKLGLISAQEMAESESRHVLIRSLGPEMFVSPDTVAVTVLAGDVLMLCSDGLYGGLGNSEIARICSQPQKSSDEIAAELVSTSVHNDGSDNTTTFVARVRSVERVGMYRGRPYRLRS